MTRPDLSIRDIQPGDAGWIIQRDADLYGESDGFDSSSEALVAQRLVSVLCVRLDPTAAKLRLFFLELELRGQGQGQRLLQAFLDHARGYVRARVTLSTHESHRAACALYARNGFQMVGQRPVTSFGVDLVAQTWTKDLQG